MMIDFVIRYDNAASWQIKRCVMGAAGPMGINHFFGCAVLMGVLHQTSFCSTTGTVMSSSFSNKIAYIAFQGNKTSAATTLTAFRTSMRLLHMNDCYAVTKYSVKLPVNVMWKMYFNHHKVFTGLIMTRMK
eukprot:scaffold187001_cov62-Attheya_sp.AAC.2